MRTASHRSRSLAGAVVAGLRRVRRARRSPSRRRCSRARSTPSSPSSSGPRSCPRSAPSPWSCRSSTIESYRVRDAAGWWLTRRGVRTEVIADMTARLHGAGSGGGAQRRRRARGDARLLDAAGAVDLPGRSRSTRSRASRWRAPSARIGHPTGVGALTGALGSSLAGVRAQAAASLRDLRAPRGAKVAAAAAALLPLLADADANVRRQAVTTIGFVGQSGGEVSGAVAALAPVVTGDPSAVVRKAAAWALGELKDGAGPRRAAAGGERSRSAGPVDCHRGARQSAVKLPRPMNERVQQSSRGCHRRGGSTVGNRRHREGFARGEGHDTRFSARTRPRRRRLRRSAAGRPAVLRTRHPADPDAELRLQPGRLPQGRRQRQRARQPRSHQLRQHHAPSRRAAHLRLVPGAAAAAQGLGRAGAADSVQGLQRRQDEVLRVRDPARGRRHPVGHLVGVPRAAEVAGQRRRRRRVVDERAEAEADRHRAVQSELRASCAPTSRRSSPRVDTQLAGVQGLRGQRRAGSDPELRVLDLPLERAVRLLPHLPGRRLRRRQQVQLPRGAGVRRQSAGDLAAPAEAAGAVGRRHRAHRRRLLRQQERRRLEDAVGVGGGGRATRAPAPRSPTGRSSSTTSSCRSS